MIDRTTEGVCVTRQDEVPDFFIIGAMKCGTTTLHHMLEQHRDVFIPRGEVFFFDIDDFEQHPDFFPYENGRWRDRDFERDLPQLWDWYQRRIAGAQQGQMIGEDSTTYLASGRAAERIARFRPDARILVMLRDPAERSYSEYWHLVRAGRALFDFEDSLSYWPHLLVQRSMYESQLERWYSVFPREQIKVVLLEDLKRDPASTLSEVGAFLGLDETWPAPTRVHSNAGTTPQILRLQLIRNRWLWRRGTRFLLAEMPGGEDTETDISPAWQTWLDAAHRRLNRQKGDTPPMRSETRRFLNAYFARENHGLSELTGLDLTDWYRDP